MLLFWLAWFAIRTRRVMTGTTPLVIKVPSLASPESCAARTGEPLSNEFIKHTYLSDNICESVLVLGSKEYILRTIEYDTGLPLSAKYFSRVTFGRQGSEYWEVQTVRATSFGSLSTIAVQGTFDIVPYLMMRFGTFVSCLELLFATDKRLLSREQGGTHEVLDASQGSQEAVPPNPPISRAQKYVGGKFDNFVSTYGNELMLSAFAVLSFIAIFGWVGALMLTPIILIHEYGHVLGYRMFGHIGNRMMLVPLMGGVAIPSGGHRSEFEEAFVAIMGPAICIPLSIGLTALAFATESHWICVWFATGAMLSSVLNALNLFPALPLDGGHSFQAIARSLAPTQTSAAMLVLTMSGAVLLEYAGYSAFAGIVCVWGGMEVARNWNMPGDARPMNLKSGAQIVLMHIGTFAIHGACAWLIWSRFY